MKKEHIAYSYELYIAAPVAEVWRGLIEPQFTKPYVYRTRFESKLAKGAPYAFLGEGDFKVVEGTIVDISREKALALTWSAHWDEAAAKDRASRVRYELTPSGPEMTKLRIVHDDFDGETATYRGSVEGWPLMLSSLKTLLETGKALPVGGS